MRGIQHAETTGALPVSEFLQQNGVVLGSEDQLTWSADTRLIDGLTVTVNRIVTDTEQTDAPAAHDPAGRPWSAHRAGKGNPAGVAGVQRVTYRITKNDGEETTR